MDEATEQVAKVRDFQNRAAYFVELNRIVPALFDISSSLSYPLPHLLKFPTHPEPNIDQFWMEQREYLPKILSDLKEIKTNKNVNAGKVSQCKEAVNILILEASYHMA